MTGKTAPLPRPAGGRKCEGDHTGALRQNLYFSQIFAKLGIYRKEPPMSATALAVAEASKQALHSEDIISGVKYILENKNILSDEEMMREMFIYSTHLTALTAHLVTSALLTAEQMDAMMEEIAEFEELGKEME